MRRSLLLLALSVFTAIPAAGQFYVSGDEPAAQKWSVVGTPNYRIVYPRGLAGFARELDGHLRHRRLGAA